MGRPTSPSVFGALAFHNRARGSMTSLLRFIACGSVDDGKSTLIGRLLADTGAIPADQMAALAADSARVGTQGAGLDYALLVDGLAAEREQGITIDVAYRFFASATRKFIVADTPGHVQYTRNMVTGASTADLAIILVDATQGVLEQTRRHSFLVHLLGVRQTVLAVNKMDLVQWDQARFDAIVADYAAFAATMGLGFAALPVCGLTGDNVVTRSPASPWFAGPTLLETLDAAAGADDRAAAPFRLAVQAVSRPNADFRGYAGLISAGTLAVGDRIQVVPSGREARIARILLGDAELTAAAAGQSVMLTLDHPVDISRGDLLTAADRPAEVADRLDATLVWMADAPAVAGGSYWLKAGTRTVAATIAAVDHGVDIATLAPQTADRLGLNDIGDATLALDRAIAFDPYADNRDTGGFILIDRVTNATVAAGLIRGAARTASNIHWQATDVDRAGRAAIKGQQPAILWFTGLSGAGKSTIANIVERKLFVAGRHTALLDGDNVRHGLNADLGFSAADRGENIRRVAAVARLMADAGLIVLVSFIAPFRAERAAARAAAGDVEFVEVFVDTPLAEAEARDAKGLYAKARAGQLPDFTGIDSPYEAPERPEIRLDTTQLTAEAAADLIVDRVLGRGGWDWSI